MPELLLDLCGIKSSLPTNHKNNQAIFYKEMGLQYKNNSGKQVQDLCEPVAVRHINPPVLTCSHMRGQAIG